MRSNILNLIGFALIITALATVGWPLAVAFAGVGFLIAGYFALDDSDDADGA